MLVKWLENDSEKGFGINGNFTNNEAIRHGLEMAAGYMIRCGFAVKAIYDELVFQCEGENIPEYVFREVSKVNSIIG
jgi:hypothetical protein